MSIWNDEAKVATLKRLWREGKSASQIADEIEGTNRNMIIGKAHRLGLPARPSPIKR